MQTDANKRNDVTQITGIILAGGAGQRMGGEDKGWIIFRNKPMIEQVIAHFKPQVNNIIISCNRNLERYQTLGYRIVLDAQANYQAAIPHEGILAATIHQGPLAGISAAMQRVNTEWSAIVPVDAPFFPTDLIEKLMRCAVSNNAKASCVVIDNKLEPTFCLLRTELLIDLHAFLQQDVKKSVQGFLNSVNAAYCQFNDASAFKNLNTPNDLT